MNVYEASLIAYGVDLEADEKRRQRLVRLERDREGEALAIKTFETEASIWLLRASSARKRLEAIKDELKELGVCTHG